MKNENALICFCKHPEPGLVKSRLANDLGEKHAAEVYKILLENTLKNVCQPKSKIFLYCFPNTNHSSIENLKEKYSLKLKKQDPGDLGEKMYRAIMRELNNYKNVVLIGTDCLELNTEYIKNAFELLNKNNEIVLGPTHDGGYALIGANKVDQSIFNGIIWGTEKVLAQTKRNISHLGWKYTCLPKLRDLDTIEDFRYYANHSKYCTMFNSL